MPLLPEGDTVHGSRGARCPAPPSGASGYGVPGLRGVRLLPSAHIPTAGKRGRQGTAPPAVGGPSGVRTTAAPEAQTLTLQRLFLAVAAARIIKGCDTHRAFRRRHMPPRHRHLHALHTAQPSRRAATAVLRPNHLPGFSEKNAAEIDRRIWSASSVLVCRIFIIASIYAVFPAERPQRPLTLLPGNIDF